MLKKVKKEDLDIPKLNDTINLLDKILKVAYVLIVIVAVFLIIKVIQALNIKSVFLVVLKTLLPLFIGLFLAWLFSPVVKKLNKKGINRALGTTIVYVLFIGGLGVVIFSMFPILSEQINDFMALLPSIFDKVEKWITGFFDNLDNIKGLNIQGIRDNVFDKLEIYGESIATALPNIMVNIVKALASGIGSFVIGLIIGFYLLMGFDNAGDLLITLFPKKMQADTRELADEMNNALRKSINGAIIDALFIFVITSIVFALIGLKAPILFGLFCGITNIIPYAGPYIGGVPAVIVGFSQGPITGILTLITIVVIQFLEGNLLQPVIMSKTTKLHPVTIMVGLLIFGHFFGIFGMVISTPILAVSKSIILFFKDKFNIEFLENF